VHLPRATQATGVGAAKGTAILVLLSQSGPCGIIVKAASILQLGRVHRLLAGDETDAREDDGNSSSNIEAPAIERFARRLISGLRLRRGPSVAGSSSRPGRPSAGVARIAKPLLFLSGPFRPFASQIVAAWVASMVLKPLFPIKYRVIESWQLILPIFFSYVTTKQRVKFIADRAERDAIWHRRHVWGGKKVYELCVRMSGYYVKSAQILGSKAEFMPPEWTEKLSVLFDQHPTSPWKEIEPAVSKDLQESAVGRRAAQVAEEGGGEEEEDCWSEAVGEVRSGTTTLMDAVFCEIDTDAIAAASIAQVHRAQLRHGEIRDVVLKVQKLGVEELIYSDLRNMKKIARFLRPYLPFDITPIADESYIQIPLEFDFEREVSLMTSINESLRKGGHDTILVPRPVYELCSPRMIVMEYMEGVPFSRLLKKGVELSESERQLLPLVEGGFRRLLDAYGRMMMIDGVFHADPHAGNLLLRENGDVVLLDYGQSKVLPPETVLFVAQLVDMLAEGDEETIIEAMSASGMKMTDATTDGDADPEIVIKSAYIFFDTRYIVEATVNPFDPDEDFIKHTNVGFNSEMWMIVRFILLLRGMFYQFDLDISAVDIWQPYARQALDRLMNDPEILRPGGGDVVRRPTGPPGPVQMVQLRRFAIWLKKRRFASDRETMKLFYLEGICTREDLAQSDPERLEGFLVDWERREVVRLHKAATLTKDKSLSRRGSTSLSVDTSFSANGGRAPLCLPCFGGTPDQNERKKSFAFHRD